jgi:pyridine nucleotide-disulfide oxidoreductase family protein
MKCLVLVGGGHAHLSLLRSLTRKKLSKLEIILISPDSYQNYSGMLPGWMAGHYSKLQFQINLQSLAQKANIRLIVNRVTGIDADKCLVFLPENYQIRYDLLSVDTGCETDLSKLGALQDRLLPIRPLDAFIKAWSQILSKKQNKSDYRLVVVGGGAAGVELALAAQYSFEHSSNKYDNGHVELVASESGLLTEFSPKIQRKVKKILFEAGITVHYLRATGTEVGLMLSNGKLLTADCVIAATGAQAPHWLQESKLILDKNGYIAVDGNHRSLSHPNIFATGDISSRQDSTIPRSGVHAVHMGPILFSNLLAILNGKQLITYHPRKYSLYILACGPRYAIASWGKWSIQGKLIWHLKDWIDQYFVRKFTDST